MRRLTAWMLGCSLLAASVLVAQVPFDPDKDVGVAVRKGAVVLTLPQGAHLNAAFMEVALKPGTPGTLKVGPLPAATGKDDLGDGIWRDRVAIPLAGEGLPARVELLVTYQPCTEGANGVCFPPRQAHLTVASGELQVLRNPATPLGEPKPEATPATSRSRSNPAGPAAPAAATPLAPKAPPVPAAPGLLWSFLAAFGFGLLASLSPCVYPMIPITMAIIGAKGSGKARGFALSLTLVLGMAVTYTTLGVLAARAGAAFGGWAQAPGFLIPVAVIFGLFALSLLGAFEIALPASLQSRLQGGSRTGFAGAFLMGLVLGPLAAPCVGPFIGTVLVAIGKDGRVLLGGAELFTFALGMGVLFLAVGTFSAALPRSGDWLVKLKQVMGVVVLGFALWTIRLVAPDWLLFALGALTLILAGTILGAFEPGPGLLRGLGKGLGLLALLLGLLCGVRAVESGLRLELLPRAAASAATAGTPRGIWLEQDLEAALAQANGRLVLVDTYAQWCAECKQLDSETWVDPRITAWIQANAVAVRIDTEQARPDLAKKYAIPGYPTVLLLDANGNELRRSVGFRTAPEMLKFLAH